MMSKGEQGLAAHQVHDEGSLASGAEADGDCHGERADGGREDGQHAEEQRHMRRIPLEPDHGVEGDGVYHCWQHPQQQPVQCGCEHHNHKLIKQRAWLVSLDDPNKYEIWLGHLGPSKNPK